VLALSDADRRALGALPPNVRAAGHFPLHLLVPTCDLVVHHGGAGSLMTAVAAGVPQLSLTFAPEQAVNADRLARSGAGVHLPGGGLRAGDVLAAVQTLLREPGYRAAAERLATSNRHQPAPAELVTTLEELAAVAVG
jgi:UDP:flavonoid glycosyltransferase YjiC (YdhE family)